MKQQKKLKIVFITPKNFVGNCAIAKHGASMGLWDILYLEDFSLDRLNNYNLIIFGAYTPAYDNIINSTKLKKAILLTSSVGQIEQTERMIELDYVNKLLGMLKDGNIDFIFVGSRDLYQVIKTDKIHYFPYPFNSSLFENFIVNNKIMYSCGLFMPTHPRKNQLNQLFGFRLSNLDMGELNLHTNTTNRVFGNINFYSWLDDEAYYRLLAQIYINLHISHVESFCYQVAESIALGTVSLVSPCIAANLDLPNDVVIDNPDSTIDISKKILKFAKMSAESYNHVLATCQRSILRMEQRNNKELAKLLKSI